MHHLPRTCHRWWCTVPEALRFASCDNFRDLINAHNCSRDDCITDIVIVSNVHLYISAFQTISTAIMAMRLRPSQSEALTSPSSEVTHVCSLVQGDKIEPCQTFTEGLNEWSNLHSNCHFPVFLMACPASSSNIVTWTHLCFNPLLICALGRGLKTKSWNIKTRIAELGVFMHKFAIENDPKP